MKKRKIPKVMMENETKRERGKETINGSEET